ncbi:MAG: GntR family transcriptional regulator [Clostridiales bacterium]|nr:GntR family transcriptional regulator [Clostridiales bacterium]
MSITAIKENYALLSELVYNAIKDSILKGELPPGEKISESSLARKLDVSRTPVREALRILYAEGFISLMPNSRFMVNEFTKEDALEVLAIRRLLEGEAARLAALSRDERKAEIIDRQRKAIPEYLQHLNDHSPSESMSFDMEFHRDIYELSGNSRLLELGEHVKDRQVRAYLANRWEEEDFVRKFTSQHSEILDAIEKGDAEEAEAKGRAHIDYLISLLK